VWLGEAVVTLQIRLLGGNMYVGSSNHLLISSSFSWHLAN
jgi:hypothetical protein